MSKKSLHSRQGDVLWKKLLYCLPRFLSLSWQAQPPGEQVTPASPDAAFTQAAETVAAELTRCLLLASPTPSILPIRQSDQHMDSCCTNTPAATNTPINSSHEHAAPCLMVGYSNATIDQNDTRQYKMALGRVFIKTWRLINAGTCTWNSSYSIGV